MLLPVRRGRALAATCMLVVGVPTARAQRPAPTLILTGGKVFTADSARPWAEAVAIRGDRIVAVGTTATCSGSPGAARAAWSSAAGS
jgi:hypothetical protein